MARKGYREEKIVKDWLVNRYGKQNVVKAAIGQAIDYIILAPKLDRIAMFVEAKGTHKKKYYMSADKDQWKRAKEMAIEHSVPLYLFIKKPHQDLEISRIV